MQRAQICRVLQWTKKVILHSKYCMTPTGPKCTVPQPPLIGFTTTWLCLYNTKQTISPTGSAQYNKKQEDTPTPARSVGDSTATHNDSEHSLHNVGWKLFAKRPPPVGKAFPSSTTHNSSDTLEHFIVLQLLRQQCAAQNTDLDPCFNRHMADAPHTCHWSHTQASHDYIL